MNSKTPANSAHSIFEIWRREDGVLAARLDAIRKFMASESTWSDSNCSEVANSLSEFRDYLLSHFQAEDELTEQLATFYTESVPEIDAMKRQSDHDHQRLLGQLDELVESLGKPMPGFDCRANAIEKIEWFADLLEQHEDQEAENVRAFMPCKE
jgi:Hemerythrin HHE cation binding domain